jgi:hypothetical protein
VANTEGSWTDVAWTITAAAPGEKLGAVKIPEFTPTDPLVLLVVHVRVPPDGVNCTHQVTAVFVVPETVAVNG